MNKNSPLKYENLVGHRVVVSPSDPKRDDNFPREYRVAEVAVAADGNLVKFINGRGAQFWTSETEYTPIADLGKYEQPAQQ